MLRQGACKGGSNVSNAQEYCNDGYEGVGEFIALCTKRMLLRVLRLLFCPRWTERDGNSLEALTILGIQLRMYITRLPLLGTKRAVIPYTAALTSMVYSSELSGARDWHCRT